MTEPWFDVAPRLLQIAMTERSPKSQILFLVVRYLHSPCERWESSYTNMCAFTQTHKRGSKCSMGTILNVCHALSVWTDLTAVYVDMHSVYISVSVCQVNEDRRRRIN